jgi:hypothetical protein
MRAANRERVRMEAAAEENPMALTLFDSESEEPNETEGVGQALQSFATPSSTQRTISTLTTLEDEGEELPPLKSVFHCGNIHTKIVNDGKEGWECGWRGKLFVPRHASRALRHLLKIKKGDIAVCKATIPGSHFARYKSLYDSGKGRIKSKKRASQFIEDSVASLQDVAVGTLLKKRGIAVIDSAGPVSTTTPFSLASAGARASMSAVSARGSKQNSFALSSSTQRTLSTMNLDIQKSNNATVEMAIADFFHCENIPDSVVESPRFIRLVRLCRLVGDDFVVPHRKKIGGELLDLNYDSIYNQNKAELLKFSKLFGLAFLGDGATIHQMALMNILAMSGATPPMTISIQDCTEHMAEGGKKDALYIANLFEEKVKEYDPTTICTDVFYFDGASNVQKAGEVLMARFPRTFCFHGGEHVVSLFFSSIAKIRPVKVSLVC